jgi:hypothetical protein
MCAACCVQEFGRGVGLYTYPEAARIVGVSPAKLRRWVLQFDYRANGHHYVNKPVIRRYFEDEPVLTFLEVVELVFIRLFRDEGVTNAMVVPTMLASRLGLLRMLTLSVVILPTT